MHIKKKGISPVIATLLLVLLAVILALVIFIWARAVITEKVQKDMGLGYQNIEGFCKDITFNADVVYINSNLNITLENTQNIPIYGVKILKISEGSRKTLGEATYGSNINSVKAGQTKDFSLETTDVAVGDKVLLVPILLGVAKNDVNIKKQYTCNEEFGVTKDVA
jgi:flagellin-like protein